MLKEWTWLMLLPLHPPFHTFNNVQAREAASVGRVDVIYKLVVVNPSNKNQSVATCGAKAQHWAVTVHLDVAELESI